MDRSDFRKMFLRVDAPIAAELTAAVESLEPGAADEPREAAGLMCHRLRGDARTVGFEILSDLALSMEQLLRPRAKAALSAEEVSFLRAAARDLQRRIQAGESACDEPLSAELTRG